MAKLTWWKILPVVGILVKNLTEALADGKITVDEIIDTVVDVVTGLGLGISLDTVGISFIKKMLTEIWDIAKDGRISGEEAQEILQLVASTFAAKLDKPA